MIKRIFVVDGREDDINSFINAFNKYSNSKRKLAYPNNLLNEVAMLYNYIDPITDIAVTCFNWDFENSEASKKFINTLENASREYNDFLLKEAINIKNIFIQDNNLNILFIHGAGVDTDRVMRLFNAPKVLITDHNNSYPVGINTRYNIKIKTGYTKPVMRDICERFEAFADIPTDLSDILNCRNPIIFDMKREE